MIRDFKDKLTEQLYKTSNIRALPPNVVERARRKLMAINAAHDLGDIRVPPSNRLEKLRGSTISGEYASDGSMVMLTRSKFATTTEVPDAAFA
ncbi:MAG: type II toxin-antitoxin system RelE/ParE family toxin [Allorhizobium sp.]|uniref:type II toxin-antitoxin system RelE/ParE family toxin n=1 Tax=Allorhizobium sp. TaxID=633478 RepID=UPI004033C234